MEIDSNIADYLNDHTYAELLEKVKRFNPNQSPGRPQGLKSKWTKQRYQIYTSFPEGYVLTQTKWEGPPTAEVDCGKFATINQICDYFGYTRGKMNHILNGCIEQSKYVRVIRLK